MSAAAELLHRLHDAGLTLEPDGPRVIVRPKSLLTDEQREAIRAHKTELLALLAGADAAPPPPPPTVQNRTCRDCAHITSYRACGEPVAAGLARKFEIIWPPIDHAATCAAWAARNAAP